MNNFFLRNRFNAMTLTPAEKDSDTKTRKKKLYKRKADNFTAEKTSSHLIALLYMKMTMQEKALFARFQESKSNHLVWQEIASNLSLSSLVATFFCLHFHLYSFIWLLLVVAASFLMFYNNNIPLDTINLHMRKLLAGDCWYENDRRHFRDSTWSTILVQGWKLSFLRGAVDYWRLKGQGDFTSTNEFLLCRSTSVSWNCFRCWNFMDLDSQKTFTPGRSWSIHLKFYVL